MGWEKKYSQMVMFTKVNINKESLMVMAVMNGKKVVSTKVNLKKACDKVKVYGLTRIKSNTKVNINIF